MLAWLALFPPHVKLRKIDDIDQCVLFVALPIQGDDPFHAGKNFHFAAWHEDLIESCKRGFVSGAEPCTPEKWWADKCSKLPKDLYYDSPEGRKKLDLNELGKSYVSDEGDDDDYEDNSWVLISEDLSATTEGRSFAEIDLAESHAEWMRDKEQILLKQGYFDTAVRDACVEIEHLLKSHLKTQLFGQRLVDKFEEAIRNQGLPPALSTSIRSRLRGAFQYVRNQYMHNVVELTRVSCMSALWHMSIIRRDLEQVIQFCAKRE